MKEYFQLNNICEERYDGVWPQMLELEALISQVWSPCYQNWIILTIYQQLNAWQSSDNVFFLVITHGVKADHS